MEVQWSQQRAVCRLLDRSPRIRSYLVLFPFAGVAAVYLASSDQVELRFSDTTKHSLVHRRGM
jgi:hypothetical protein